MVFFDIMLYIFGIFIVDIFFIGLNIVILVCFCIYMLWLYGLNICIYIWFLLYVDFIIFCVIVNLWLSINVFRGNKILLLVFILLLNVVFKIFLWCVGMILFFMLIIEYFCNILLVFVLRWYILK